MSTPITQGRGEARPVEVESCSRMNQQLLGPPAGPVWRRMFRALPDRAAAEKATPTAPSAAAAPRPTLAVGGDADGGLIQLLIPMKQRITKRARRRPDAGDVPLHADWAAGCSSRWSPGTCYASRRPARRWITLLNCLKLLTPVYMVHEKDCEWSPPDRPLTSRGKGSGLTVLLLRVLRKLET